MNYIALTGSDMHAMAEAAEILLELVSLSGLQVAIALHVNSVQMATTVRDRAGPHGIGQLWRIGDDTAHPRLDHLVDVRVSTLQMQVDPCGFLYERLQALRVQLLAHQPLTPQEPQRIQEKTA